MKRSGPLRRRTPLARTNFRRRVIPKPVELDAAEAVVRLRSGGDCEAVTERCTGRAAHVHHVAGRWSHHPADLLDVCSACHGYIHANPKESYDRGWMRRRHGAN